VVARERSLPDENDAGGFGLDELEEGAGGGAAVAIDGAAHPPGRFEEGDIGDEDVVGMLEADGRGTEELGGLGEIGGDEMFAGCDALVDFAPRCGRFRGQLSASSAESGLASVKSRENGRRRGGG